jgi:hypothetical protein
MPIAPTAAQFLKALRAVPPSHDPSERKALLGAPGDRFLGVRMGQVFTLAKQFLDLPPSEIERLLESPIHEARVGGLSIMD